MVSYVKRGRSLAALGSFTFLNLTPSVITAHAGGTKPLATPATSASVQISVCATAADSVLLPAPAAGDTMLVLNSGAAAAQLFGAGTSTINGAATGTGVSLATLKLAILTAYTAGAWTMTVLN